MVALDNGLPGQNVQDLVDQGKNSEPVFATIQNQKEMVPQIVQDHFGWKGPAS